MYNKLADWLYSNGYIKAWFSWIEWVTLTSAFIAVGWNKHLTALIVIGSISGIFLFEFALRGVVNTLRQLLDKANISRWVRWALAVVFGLIMPGFIMYLIGMSIYAFVSSACNA